MIFIYFIIFFVRGKITYFFMSSFDYYFLSYNIFMSFFVIFTRRTSQEFGKSRPRSIFYVIDTDVYCVNKTLVQFLRAGCKEYFVYF